MVMRILVLLQTSVFFGFKQLLEQIDDRGDWLICEDILFAGLFCSHFSCRFIFQEGIQTG